MPSRIVKAWILALDKTLPSDNATRLLWPCPSCNLVCDRAIKRSDPLELEYFELTGENDEFLLELAKHGETDAIDILFSRHRPILRRSALRFLRNEAEAEDVVQDSLTLAFVHLSQYQGRAQFRTWLLSILLNVARTRLRSRKRDRSLSLEQTLDDQSAEPIMTLRDPGPGPDQMMAAEERRRIVRETLNCLSSDFRTAYDLCYVKGLSTREAADSLGVNQETLKVRLFRGKRKLRTRVSALNSKTHPMTPRRHLHDMEVIQERREHVCLPAGESPIQ
jgi:RNA polymerase sigma-70 factor, ECF subfamily